MFKIVQTGKICYRRNKLSGEVLQCSADMHPVIPYSLRVY